MGLRSFLANCLTNWRRRSQNGKNKDDQLSTGRVVETVAIGLNEKSKIGGSPPAAKLKSFRPRLVSGRLELSSFSMDDLIDHERWALLDRHSNKPVVGRSELPTAIVLYAELAVEPDWVPEGHVNIVGWSSEEDREASAAQVLFANQSFFRR